MSHSASFSPGRHSRPRDFALADFRRFTRAPDLFVGVEEVATSIFPGMYVHEFVHDGRRLLGFLH
jgi:hypothetical protein